MQNIGNRHTNLARGFTLLELLMVVVIVAVMAGLTVLATVDRRQSSMEREALRLKAVIDSLVVEAVFQQTPYGLSIFNDGYRVLVWNFSKSLWQAVDENQNLFSLPSFLQIEPQEKNTFEYDNLEQDKEIHPSIIFYPDQHIDNFTIIISIKDTGQRIGLYGRQFKGIDIVRL